MPELTEIKRRGVSFSQFALWRNCPLSWKLQNVDEYERESGIALVFGTAVHNTIQHWLKIYYQESPAKAKVFDMNEMLKSELMSLAKKELLSGPTPLTTSKELTEYYFDGCNILEHMRKHVKDWFAPGYELLGVELPLEKELPNNLLFRGYLDAVVWHKAAKTLYIYDFKTSTRGWKDFQKKDTNKTDQLLLYKHFYSDLYDMPIDNIKVEFIILKRKVTPHADFPVKHVAGFEPSHGKISMKKALDRFNEFLTEAFDSNGQPRLDNIKATPSEKACKYCPFNNDTSKCQFSFYLSQSKRKITKSNAP